jgi:hypothetical protein
MFLSWLSAKAPERCPKCGGPVTPIVYGLPTEEMGRRAKAGEIVLGGCMVDEKSPTWLCGNCGARGRGDG